MDSFDLISSLHTLPETNPIEVDGIQFGPKKGGNRTCQQACIGLLTVQVNSVCIGVTC